MRSESRDHIGRGQPARLQLGNVDVDLDLALLAAIGVGDRGALDGHQPGADEVERKVVEVLLGKRLAARAQLENRHARRAVLQDERGGRACGQLAKLRLRNGGDLRHGHVNFDRGMEINLYDRNAVERLRLDVLDVVDGRGQRALRDGNDALLHLFRRKAGVVPDDADDGDVDVGENINGHFRNGHEADQENQQCSHQEGVRPIEREFNDPHGEIILPSIQFGAGIAKR